MPLIARIRASQTGRDLFAVLLLCVLAIRIAIPVGFMPTATAGGLTFSVCAESGLGKLTAGQDDPAQKQHQGAKDCAFAIALGGGLIGADAPALPPEAPRFAYIPETRAIADLTVHRLAAPPPPAQAPPARA